MALDEESPILSDEQVARMQSRLDERQLEILFRRIGYGYHRIQSLTYIAKDFKLSRERIRQIQNESLLKLNDPTVTHLVLLAETRATYERNESRREKFLGTLTWRSSSRSRNILEEQKAIHAAAYESWSEDEDLRLWDERQLGKTTQEIAKIHSRSVGAIRARLKKIREGVVTLKGIPVAESEPTQVVQKKRQFGIPPRTPNR